ncbi:MAG: phosphoribosyltransferase family protein [Gemmatimonadota bacterium]
MTQSPGFQIADRERVHRVLGRMARRVHAELGPDIRLVGILRRGAPIARELAGRLAELVGREVETGTLRLERYADDLTVIHDEPRLGEEDLPFEVEGARIVLVDDVIFTARTFLRALVHLDAAGAAEVHLAALCSRGPNEVPVHPGFVGLQVDVGEGNVVEVHAPPYEEEWGIHLLHRK